MVSSQAHRLQVSLDCLTIVPESFIFKNRHTSIKKKRVGQRKYSVVRVAREIWQES